jgi:hypothetical protein
MYVLRKTTENGYIYIAERNWGIKTTDNLAYAKRYIYKENAVKAAKKLKFEVIELKKI